MGQGLGGFMGVASFSKQKSLRVTTTGAKSYDAWQFIAGQRLAFGKAPTIGAGPGILNPLHPPWSLSARPGDAPAAREPLTTRTIARGGPG